MAKGHQKKRKQCKPTDQENDILDNNLIPQFFEELVIKTTQLPTMLETKKDHPENASKIAQECCVINNSDERKLIRSLKCSDDFIGTQSEPEPILNKCTKERKNVPALKLFSFNSKVNDESFQLLNKNLVKDQSKKAMKSYDQKNQVYTPSSIFTISFKANGNEKAVTKLEESNKLDQTAKSLSGPTKGNLLKSSKHDKSLFFGKRTTISLPKVNFTISKKKSKREDKPLDHGCSDKWVQSKESNSLTKLSSKCNKAENNVKISPFKKHVFPTVQVCEFRTEELSHKSIKTESKHADQQLLLHPETQIEHLTMKNSIESILSHTDKFQTKRKFSVLNQDHREDCCEKSPFKKGNKII